MNDWENKQFEGIYYTRFIASWFVAGGPHEYGLFRSWLETLTINGKKIPEDVIRDVANLFDTGKLELEERARFFLSMVTDY